MNKGTHQNEEWDHRHAIVGRDIEHLLSRHGKGGVEGPGVDLQPAVTPPDQRLPHHIGTGDCKTKHAHQYQRKPQWNAGKGRDQKRDKTNQ